jgi:hypothetical protein
MFPARLGLLAPSSTPRSDPVVAGSNQILALLPVGMHRSSLAGTSYKVV